jgi:hypothetical protein
MITSTSSTLCAISRCGCSGSTALQGRQLCRSHFIATSYQRLEECSAQLARNEHWKALSGEPLVDLLAQIVDQAAALGLTAKDLDGLERAQLLDILFAAGHMMKDLRRSVRRPVSIPLQLCYQVTGHSWTEKTITQELSAYGASMECRIPIAKGELMTVERVDLNRRAQAKVRWNKRRINGTQTIGIELLDCSDFWGFNEG